MKNLKKYVKIYIFITENGALYLECGWLVKKSGSGLYQNQRILEAGNLLKISCRSCPQLTDEKTETELSYFTQSHIFISRIVSMSKKKKKILVVLCGP